MKRIALVVAMLLAISSARAESIADYFGLYYQSYQGQLAFLRDAVAAHMDAGKLLVPGTARSVVIDRANGYLRIDDSSDTDQTLTMAAYRKSDGGLLLVVGSADCADG